MSHRCCLPGRGAGLGAAGDGGVGVGEADVAAGAWAIAYNLVAETMLEGAASARPIGA